MNILVLSIKMFFFVILTLCPISMEGANILVYLPSASTSHFKPFQPLFMALAKRGHNVTVVSMFPPDEKNENYTHMQMGDEFKLPSTGFAYLRQQNYLQNYLFMYNVVQILGMQCMTESNTQKLLQSDSTKFDLIIMELYHFDTYFALGGHFKAPIIGLSFQSLVPIYHWILKNPWNFATAPHLYSPFSDAMDFPQRLANTLFGVFTVLMYNFVALPKYQKQIDSLMKANNVQDVPRIEEVTKNLSLVLVESHFTVGYARPNLPNVVEVAGIHIPPKGTLPQDIAEFLNGAKNGFIYVSMGTLIAPVTLHHLGKKLTYIFENLPYRVVLKWNPKLIQSTSKILVREWLPQTDILSHPNMKLFISHGGHHSVIEAVNSGVPILCLPFFTDQYYTTAMVEKHGFGKGAELEASEQELLNVVKELLDNDRYMRSAKGQSLIFKDRPMSPLDLAVYWTEYVIRHGGAPHLKSAATQLSWYQYLLLDVILFIAVILFCLIYVLKRIGIILCINFTKFGRRLNKLKAN